MVQPEAEEMLTPAILSRAWMVWGWEQFCQGHYDEARQAFEKAIELDPSNFRAYYGLGRYFLRVGNWTEAERAFQRCLESNPYSALGEEGLMRLARRRRRCLRAIQLFLRAAVKSVRHIGDDPFLF